MKIAVGTVSEQKIGYLREILAEVGVSAETFPVGVSSEIAEQPFTSDEVKRGSLNRARHALEKVPDADISIGIEVGYEKDKNGSFWMFCWGTAIDKAGFIISHKSNEFLLPAFFQSVLQDGRYVSDSVAEYKRQQSDTAGHVIADIVTYRKPFIVDAVRNVLLRYVKREEFERKHPFL